MEEKRESRLGTWDQALQGRKEKGLLIIQIESFFR